MTAFPPLLGNAPKSLILGSMPSQISLREQQYYANPQNAFWWIMSQIAGFSQTESYQDRVAKLTGFGIAVWDVLLDCVREGSLDSNIQRGSELVNDLSGFIHSVPSVKLIAFNGQVAKQLFMRHCGSVLQQFPHLEWVLLPSTSPAHAAMTKTQKLQIWGSALV